MEANTAKALSMVALGLGSFVSGMAPACISEDARRKHPLLISCLLCFGAGVLLSTSLAHMLPEAREKLPDLSELMLCVGFFIVYFVDEIVHLCNGDREHGGLEDQQRYGSGEETRLLRSRDGGIENDQEMRERCGGAGPSNVCHVNHQEPCSQSSSGIVGLLCALFVHSVLEGLAIGLQETSAQVLLLLGAVCAHKYVVGFCLGAELCATSNNLCKHIIFVVLFSIGSVAGIGIGACLETVNSLKNSQAVPIMQALAAGTLLYVTVSEVLPRERARWHARSRGAGVAQLAAVLVGFVLMYLTTLYLDQDGA